MPSCTEYGASVFSACSYGRENHGLSLPCLITPVTLLFEVHLCTGQTLVEILFCWFITQLHEQRCARREEQGPP